MSWRKGALCAALLLAYALGATADVVTPSEPQITPVPVGIAIGITGENDRLMEEGWVQISYSAPQEEIEFFWQGVEDAQSYAVAFYDKENELQYAGDTAETTVRIPAEKIMDGRYRMTVRAMAGGTELLADKIEFELVKDMSGSFPGSMQGGMSFRGMGGMASGSRGVRGGEQESRGFSVTPGEKLTSSHSPGTKSLLAHGAVEAKIADDEMQMLTVGGEEMEICRADGAPFSARIEGDMLKLTGDADVWRVNMGALKTLEKSGIDVLVIDLNDGQLRIDTDMRLTGSEYAALSAQGYVSKDYTLIVSGEQIIVEAAGSVWTLRNGTELVGR